MAGIKYVFNENTLSLEITADPKLLPKTVIDFMTERKTHVDYRSEHSSFSQWRLDYSAGNEFTFQNMNVADEFGLSKGNYTLLTDSLYIKNTQQSHLIRLQSNITYDRRQDLQRFVAGDVTAVSGELGSSVLLGGLSLAKIYSMDPYLVNFVCPISRGLCPIPRRSMYL